MDLKSCECYLCHLVRTVDVPTQFLKHNPETNKPKRRMFCLTCREKYEFGEKHICPKKITSQNLKTFVTKKFPQKVNEELASGIIKNLIDKQNMNQSSNKLQLSHKQGRKMKICIGEVSVSNAPQISVEDLSKISLDLNLTSNKTKALSRNLRIATNNRKIIEANSDKKLRELSHSVDSLFEFKECDILYEKKNERSIYSKTVIFCNNINSFIQTVLQKRNLTLSDVHLKFGMDGGGGFFKICLSIQKINYNNSDFHEFPKRQKFSEGVASKVFKDTGVKKTLLLALVEKAQENYENVSMLFSLLKIDVVSAKGTVATDLKLGNISCGLMPHSCKCPCTWCTACKSELHKCGEYRTIFNCKHNYSLWQLNGGGKEQAKNYMNCIHPPIYTAEDESISIIDIIPPPELHLLIGGVNTLYNHMIIECEKDSLEWTTKCSVNRDFVNGSPSFDGNSCKKLLDNVDYLSELCSINCLKYVQCFRDFKAVVDSCFSDSLKPNYKDYIAKFKESYIALSIPITPKIHAIFFHVPDFCDKVKRGLSFYSEQAVETIHADFKETWSKFKRSSDHPKYADNLLRAVQEYNAKHM